MKLLHSKVLALMCASVVLFASFTTHAHPFKQFAPQALRAAQIAGATAVLVGLPAYAGYRSCKNRVLEGNRVDAEKIAVFSSGVSWGTMMSVGCNSLLGGKTCGAVMILGIPLIAYTYGCVAGLKVGEKALLKGSFGKQMPDITLIKNV